MSEDTVRETMDLPGVGEIRPRRGTAVHELAGGIRFWHDRAKFWEKKYANARNGGLLAGLALSLATAAVAYVVCHFLI